MRLYLILAALWLVLVLISAQAALLLLESLGWTAAMSRGGLAGVALVGLLALWIAVWPQRRRPSRADE
jgi:hypothetical protein